MKTASSFSLDSTSLHHSYKYFLEFVHLGVVSWFIYKLANQPLHLFLEPTL